MDQLPVEIKIDDYWNPQLHAFLKSIDFTHVTIPFTI